MTTMYIILNIALIAAAFAAGSFAAKKSRTAGDFAAIAGLVILFSQIFLFFHPEWELAIFRFDDYIFFRWWGLSGAFILIGAARERVAPHDRKALAFFAVFAMGAASYLLYQTVYDRIADYDQAGFLNDICLQSTGYTCAPASCATVLKKFGITATEKEMTELCVTQRLGTGYINVVRGLRLKLGDSWRVEIERPAADRLAEIPRPFLTNIYLEGAVLHMVSVCDVGSSEVKFADTLVGRMRKMKFAQFVSCWDGRVVYAVRK